MEYHDQYHDQRSPNPDKKDNKGPKGKESKPPQAKTKKIKGISNLSPLSVIQEEKNETMWLRKFLTKWRDEVKRRVQKTMTKYM